MYILDTCDLGEVFKEGQQTLLGQRVSQVSEDLLFISVVTVEEMLWGRVNAIKAAVKQTNQDERVIATLPDLCRAFEKTIARLKDWKVIPFDTAAAARYRAIPRATRAGRLNDCRIAAVALAHDFTVISQNQKDFIPIHAACGVKWEDWSIDPARTASHP